MTDFFSITKFLDLEAAIDNEEEEEDYNNNNKLAHFFDDDDLEEEMDWDWTSGAIANARGARGSPQHLLLSAEGGPKMWAVHIKPEHESDLVYQITTLCLTRNPFQQLNIMLVFAHPGILGWIFIEGQSSDVATAIHGLITVYHEKQSPKKASGSKHKRPAHLELQKWTLDQVKVVWGNKVKNISKDNEEYEFLGETYKLGLVLKHLPPASVTLLASAPSDIGTSMLV
ncbi:hypothetical protein EI94DRAFT_1710776 [Lactarius quietus]|nr:hypothetical protein EI94DRAFT_1710776 [Lactarius quietus]